MLILIGFTLILTFNTYSITYKVHDIAINSFKSRELPLHE